MPRRRAGIIRSLVAMACLAAGASRPARAQDATPAPAAVAARAESTGVDSAANLAPTTAPPWNPPARVAAVEPWEFLLQLPGRIVTLPLSVLGAGARGG